MSAKRDGNHETGEGVVCVCVCVHLRVRVRVFVSVFTGVRGERTRQTGSVRSINKEKER